MKNLFVLILCILSMSTFALDPLLDSIENSVTSDQSILLKDLKSLTEQNMELIILGEKTGIGGGAVVAKSSIHAIILDDEVVTSERVTKFNFKKANSSALSDLVSVQLDTGVIVRQNIKAVILKKTAATK